MEKSYDEIKRIMALTDPERKIPVYKGSRRFLIDKKTPEITPAAENIVKTAMECEDKLYVAAIGAITNVASAMLIKPEIINKIIIVWLGGNSLQSPDTHEFNMYQDIKASQIIFDCGVPLVQIPCDGVCSALTTTVPEIEYYLKGKNELCDYLVDIIKGYTNDPFCWSKVIWDISAIACMTLPYSMERVIIPAPVITDDGYYASDNARNPMIYVRRLNRDLIFRDVFTKLMNK
jgi:inosine-uridine nucleoside N-ribohydrolase